MDDLEELLIAAETSDPYSVLVIDPKTGVSNWSYKGNEMQDAITGGVERVGEKSDRFIVYAKDKPLVHLLSMRRKKRLHVKSVVNKPIGHLVVTPDGAVLFASIDAQIFAWMIGTGELIAAIDAHYRKITALALSCDGSLLISGAEDGSLCVHLVSEIMSSAMRKGGQSVKAFREWRPHSLAVSCISLTRNANLRVLSCSRDHTAALFSIAMNDCILKISSDVALTACAIDPAECRLFLGTLKGFIAEVDLYGLTSDEFNIVFGAGSNVTFPLFAGHSSEIKRLDVNHDGSVLASGDAKGNYFIWDILNRQTLKTSSCRGSICKLKFVTKWRNSQLDGQLSEDSMIIPAAVLGRRKIEGNSCIVSLIKEPVKEHFVESDRQCKTHLDQLLNNYIIRHKKEPQLANDSENGAKNGLDDEKYNSQQETIKSLKKEIFELKKANKRLYECASLLITDES